jgi:hypothetical protein
MSTGAPLPARIFSSRRNALAVALVYGIVFLTTAVTRVAIREAVVTPDGKLYLLLAENLLRHGCYSQSLPDNAECVPTWTSQPPGYPLFLAGCRAVLGASPTSIVVAQSIIYAAAVVYLLFAARRLLDPPLAWMLAAGLLIGCSPLTVSWSHWILTETLAGAGVLWVMAECVRSLSRGELRTVMVTAALTTSVLVRWDLVWLVAPVLLVAWYLHEPRPAIRRSFAALCGPGSAILFLMVRAAAVGLPFVPPYPLPPDEVPPGIASFWREAATTPAATSALLWNVWGRNYSAVAGSFDYQSVSRVVDVTRLRSVLRKLSAVPDGTEVPHDISEEFAALAYETRQQQRGIGRLEILVTRSTQTWGRRDFIHRSGWHQDHERWLQPYRSGLVGLTLVAPWLFRSGPQRVLSLGVLLLLMSRTLFLAAMTCLEVRYDTPLIPALELVLAMLALTAFRWGKLERPAGARH